MAISRFSLKTENLATLGSYCYSASCSGLANATHCARQPSARACANCQARLWTGESSTKALAFQPTFTRGCSSQPQMSWRGIPKPHCHLLGSVPCPQRCFLHSTNSHTALVYVPA